MGIFGMAYENAGTAGNVIKNVGVLGNGVVGNVFWNCRKVIDIKFRCEYNNNIEQRCSI